VAPVQLAGDRDTDHAAADDQIIAGERCHGRGS
jgi:hypothetical protein